MNPFPVVRGLTLYFIFSIYLIFFNVVKLFYC